MKLLFLGGLFPLDMVSSIESNSKGVIQYAANKLQWNFVKGFDYFYDTEIVTLPFVGSFPFLYKNLIVKKAMFSHVKNANDISQKFINIFLYKHFSRFYNLKRVLIEKLEATNDDNLVIVIYSIHTPFLLAATHIKNKYKNLKICLIIPDLPEYMSDNNSILYRLFKKIDSVLFMSSINKIDYFVTLTEEIMYSLGISDKQWVRIEGIYENPENIPCQEKNSKKVVLYSGTIDSRYGIKNLLKAFISISDTSYELWICGEGDTRKEIERLSMEDIRIKYLGQLPQNEVYKLQKRATVLVNPRTSEGEFTKYSFPSKTMEYLASGTPTIIHRLPGIPDEYFNYAIVCEEENPDGLRSKIMEVCEKSIIELEAIGKLAREFILKEKNAYSQVKKVVEMIN